MGSGNGSRGLEAPSEGWTAEQVRDMLTNPAYAYGHVLEPMQVASEQVQQLERALAQEQQKRGRPFSLEELDQRFQELFEYLIEEGICQRGPKAQPLVSKEQWLKSQQVRVERLARGEET